MQVETVPTGQFYLHEDKREGPIPWARILVGYTNSFRQTDCDGCNAGTCIQRVEKHPNGVTLVTHNARRFLS